MTAQTPDAHKWTQTIVQSQFSTFLFKLYVSPATALPGDCFNLFIYFFSKKKGNKTKHKTKAIKYQKNLGYALQKAKDKQNNVTLLIRRTILLIEKLSRHTYMYISKLTSRSSISFFWCLSISSMSLTWSARASRWFRMRLMSRPTVSNWFRSHDRRLLVFCS